MDVQGGEGAVLFRMDDRGGRQRVQQAAAGVRRGEGYQGLRREGEHREGEGKLGRCGVVLGAETWHEQASQ